MAKKGRTKAGKVTKKYTKR